jgi:hypothetical protein
MYIGMALACLKDGWCNDSKEVTENGDQEGRDRLKGRPGLQLDGCC